MDLFSFLRRGKAAAAAPALPALPAPQAEIASTAQAIVNMLGQESTGWASQSLFMLGTSRKYNPDDLVSRRGARIWSQMMLDEQVKAAVAFRRAAITGRNWHFTLDHKAAGITEEEAKRRIQIFTDMVKLGYKGKFSDGLNKILRSLWQGYSFTEKLFDTFRASDGKTYVCLRELRPKPYETFEVDSDDYGNVIRWVQKHPASYEERTVDMDRYVYHVNAPDMDEHYGQSELRSAYRWWFAKDFTIRFMNVFAERLAGGFVVCRPSTGVSAMQPNSPDHLALKSILSNITGNTALLLPGGYELEVHYAPAGQTDVFTKILSQQDLAIAKSLLIPNLLGLSDPKAQTGSYSQGGTQFDVFIVVSDDDADRLAETVNEQIFSPLGLVTFEDGVAPKFEFKPLSDSKLNALLNSWNQLTSNNAVVPSETDEAHIRKLIGFPERGTPLPNPDAAGTGPDSGPPGGGADRPPRRVQNANASLQAKDVLRTYSRERAISRVAIEVIEQQAEGAVAAALDRLQIAIVEAIAAAFAKDVTPEKFEIRAGGLNAAFRRAMRAAFDIGETHAKTEMDQAKRERFSKRLDMARINEMAAEWLQAKSFTMAGDLSADVTSEIKNTLVNGLKYDWSVEEVKQRAYKALATKGFVSGDAAAEALGMGSAQEFAERLDVRGSLSASRLETIIRTNMFEAINEARYNAFTDPELGGFVTGFTYSAILDSRTTEVCRHMNGRTYTAEQWEQELRPWVPPNHFNCRSLLVPVTTLDTDVEITDGLPSIDPQEGFR